MTATLSTSRSGYVAAQDQPEQKLHARTKVVCMVVGAAFALTVLIAAAMAVQIGSDASAFADLHRINNVWDSEIAKAAWQKMQNRSVTCFSGALAATLPATLAFWLAKQIGNAEDNEYKALADMAR